MRYLVKGAIASMGVATLFFALAGCGAKSGTPLPSAGAFPDGSSSIVEMSPSRGSSEQFAEGHGPIPSTYDGIHAFISFDYNVSYHDAKTDAMRYDLVWGAANPTDWTYGNPAIVNTFYLPFETDGDRKNSLSWWQTFHPDWVLYRCDQKTPAWADGLKNVPLDISNPAAVQWQIQTYGAKAESGYYQGIAADLVAIDNADGGCGVWSNGQWVAKFSGQDVDPAWAQAVEGWAATAFAYLHSLPRPLILAANHVPSNALPGDPNEQALIAHLDIDEDELGFSDYGNGPVPDGRFKNAVAWMGYAQSIGRGYMVIDKWKTPTVTGPELDWSIATYLMGKRAAAALDVVDAKGYGYEYWFSQYGAAIGHACGPMYVSQGVYMRDFSGGLAIVNTSRTEGFNVSLPFSPATTIDGTKVSSPLTVAAATGTVLLKASAGCP